VAEKVIETLITKLSFDVDQKKLHQFELTLSSIEKGLKLLTTAYDTAVAFIDKFVGSVAEANDQLYKFSQRTGIDVQSLQELGYAAELNGGSIDSMNSSLENLSKISSEAARGVGAGVEVFGMLGLSATDTTGRIKSADALLLEISDSVSKLGTQAEKLELTQKLGIGPDLLLTIEQGSDAIKRQRQEAQELGFVINNNAGQAAANFNDAMLRTSKIMQGLANIIGTKLMKVLTPIIEAFNNWFKANRRLIQSGLKDFLDTSINAFRATFNILVRVYKTIEIISKGFGGFKNTITAVGTALLILNAKALIIPITIAAAILAIGLLIDELVKFDQGGDTVLGNIVDGSVNLEAALKTLIFLAKQVGVGWKLIFTDGEEAFEGFLMMIDDAISYVSDIIDSIKDLGTTIKMDFIDQINKGIELLNKLPGINVGPISSATNYNPIPLASAGGVSGIGNVSNITNNTSTPNISININGGNVTEVRDTIQEVLNEHYTNANVNLQTGIA
jgi:hypothetical protein